MYKYNEQVFYKKAVLENFAIFVGKQLCWSLFFNKLQTFNPTTKSRIQHRYFPVYIANVLGTPALKNI